jgi:hypothetical protein
MGMTTPDIAGLCERLRAITTTDHERLCQGREYTCSCGWDEENAANATQAADTLERQAAENKRLREALQEFSREYDGFLDGDGHPCPTLARARAALTGEDTATLSLSGKTQTDANIKEIAAQLQKYAASTLKP